MAEQSFSAKKNEPRIELPRYGTVQIRVSKMTKEGCSACEDHIATLQTI
jgi:hypothetical protein